MFDSSFSPEHREVYRQTTTLTAFLRLLYELQLHDVADDGMFDMLLFKEDLYEYFEQHIKDPFSLRFSISDGIQEETERYLARLAKPKVKRSGATAATLQKKRPI